MLVVGLDGATNRVIDPLVAAGELPNLARIAREGVRAAVRPAGPILSPRIWTTFATGLPAERHGVHGWGKPGAQGRARLYTNLDRRVPALWNIVGAAGRRVGVVNWLMTQPPDRVNGVMISDHGVPSVAARRMELAQEFAEEVFGVEVEEVVAPEVTIAYAWPLDWVRRSRAIRGEALPPLSDEPNPFAGEEGAHAEFLRGIHRDDELTVHTALEVEEKVRPALLMVYLPGIDRVSHLLWEPIPSAPEPGRAGSLPAQRTKALEQLFAYYRFSDALLGQLPAGFGPDDFVLVISDHGFEAGSGPPEMPGVHASERARDGILYARGPGIEPATTAPPLRGVDVLPTLLAALGLPQARDLPGQVAPFLEATPVEAVSSYADLPIERVETKASGVDEEILEKLRTLGYVE